MEESPYLQPQSDLVARLGRLPALAGLDAKYVKRIVARSKIRRYAAGEEIAAEGARDAWLYLLLGGEVRVVKAGEEIARLAQVGDTFGEMAVVDGGGRSASVEAVTDTVCLAVDTAGLAQGRDPDATTLFLVLYRLLAEVIAGRLRAANEELAELRREVERLRRRRR